MTTATDPEGNFAKKEAVKDDAEQAEVKECESIKMKIHNTIIALRLDRKCGLVLGR